MIAAVSLRLFYLIFLQLVSLLVLLTRSSASKHIELFGIAPRSRRTAKSQPEAPPGLDGSSSLRRARPGSCLRCCGGSELSLSGLEALQW